MKFTFQNIRSERMTPFLFQCKIFLGKVTFWKSSKFRKNIKLYFDFEAFLKNLTFIFIFIFSSMKQIVKKIETIYTYFWTNVKDSIHSEPKTNQNGRTHRPSFGRTVLLWIVKTIVLKCPNWYSAMSTYCSRHSKV